MKDRIIELLNTEGLSASKFADIIGVQRSSMSHILSGRNNPSLDFIQKIIRSFPYISGDWLISGRGEMTTKNKTSADLFQETTDDESSMLQQTNEPSKVKKDVFESNHSKSNKASELNISAFISDKKIEKVVVFYADKTFREYNPA